MREEVTEPASWAVGTFPGSAVTQQGIRARQCLAVDGLGCGRKMKTAKQERSTGNMGSVGPLGRRQNLPWAFTLLGTVCH